MKTERDLSSNKEVKLASRRFSGLFAMSMAMTMQAAVATPNSTKSLSLLNNASIVGKVFFDANLNGILDAGERGIPGVKLSTVTGLLIETDGEGRYHIADNEIKKSLSGLNVSQHQLLKVDTYSLPEASVLTSENPRLIRLTSAGLNTVNFGVVFK